MTSRTASDDRTALRARTEAVCDEFDDAYWRETDRERRYPQEFVDAMGAAGLLSVMIPREYGGGGYGIDAATGVMEAINRSGGHSAACHAQMYTMAALLRHGTDAQKDRYLPGIADGSIRLQAFSITEDAGSDTLAITTTATPDGDSYVIDGHKTWTSRFEESDLALVLTRTSETPKGTTDGLTLFLLDLREIRAQQPDALLVTPVRTMFNYATNQVTYRSVRVPADAVIGRVGNGFRHVLDGWNAERILLASEAIGDGYWFIERAVSYAKARHVFGRAIGTNQGVQFPIADAYMKVRAAELMRDEATARFDAGEPAGAEANMAKLLSSEASWAAANMCLDTHGGYGFVDEYDVERKFRETRMFSVAPINNNLVRSFVATKVLGLPKSY
ncbi:acyl-CoA dehydrogenase family protein [Pseudoclavibacter sp. 8L]|uniref:acyl-CoA dehydrogenase family protein n=1 Tax=Pseudoclavibacter sp. 8L TaxID=2653162 RepID=UPI0012F21DB2|nr:acyl-CoA dehydrogenase family protein [Pseudoclavibacter sp. 8L]VXB89090.1 Acyl-CoA dehydrogenase [Pseudoclavibacter sp. 8L]